LLSHLRAHEGATLPAARGATKRNKATAKQPPLVMLLNKESDTKGRLRVSCWIMQGLYDYAVKKAVEL
jgi:hypothetical protein